MRLIVMILSGLLLAACTMMGPVKTAPVAAYTITNTHAESNKTFASRSDNTLLVTMPMATPGIDTTDMVYVQVPYQLKSFASHRWVSPPATLLMPLFADNLRDTHAFKAVVTVPFSGVTTFQLNTQLLTLQQEFISPTSCVRLRIAATLLRVSTGQVIASRVFEVVVPAPGNNPYSGVLATNEAARRVVEQMKVFVLKNS